MLPLAGTSPSYFPPETLVAALSVEDTCVLVHVFLLSLSLFIVHCGGSGTWLCT